MHTFVSFWGWTVTILFFLFCHNFKISSSFDDTFTRYLLFTVSACYRSIYSSITAPTVCVWMVHLNALLYHHWIISVSGINFSGKCFTSVFCFDLSWDLKSGRGPQKIFWFLNGSLLHSCVWGWQSLDISPSRVVASWGSCCPKM